MSQSPGMTNLPRPSTTWAPLGDLLDDLSICAMRPPRTMTVMSGFGAAPVASMTVTCAIASVFASRADWAPAKCASTVNHKRSEMNFIGRFALSGSRVQNSRPMISAGTTFRLHPRFYGGGEEGNGSAHHSNRTARALVPGGGVGFQTRLDSTQVTE